MHEITLPVGFHADPVWLRKDASLWPGVPLQGWCRHQLPHSGLGTLRMGRGLRMRGRARGESKGPSVSQVGAPHPRSNCQGGAGQGLLSEKQEWAG